MSETIETAPQDGGALAPEPAVTTEAPAPAETGAASDTTDDTTPEPAKPSRTERRIAALSARLSAGEAERNRLAAELEQYRRQAPPQPERPPTAEDIPRLVEQRVAAELEQRLGKERADRFHEQGRAEFKDWQDKCQSLISMGADAQFAQLLLDAPDGVKVAAALADDPEAMEAIAALKTERGRALALGRFAATLEAKPAAPVRSVSRAPAPIRPVTGSAKAEFNEYLEADASKLSEYYARQHMERRRR